MTIQEIKSAVDAGKTVYWKNHLYRVIKDSKGQYLISSGTHFIGLTWQDGETLNGNPEDFFIKEKPNYRIIEDLYYSHIEETEDDVNGFDVFKTLPDAKRHLIRNLKQEIENYKRAVNRVRMITKDNLYGQKL